MTRQGKITAGAALLRLGRLIAATATVLAVSACQIDGAGKPEPVGQARVDALHAACIRRGGEFVQAVPGSFLCLEHTADNGQSCAAASDCESACLARSRTCAPVKPLLGCNEILTGSGLRVTQCIE